MRITNRVIITRETKDKIETRVTERIVEDDQGFMLLPGAAIQGIGESTPSTMKVQCNICTGQFEFGNDDDGRCPDCGSRDVSLV